MDYVCPYCRSGNINTNNGDCRCLECGSKWDISEMEQEVYEQEV